MVTKYTKKHAHFQRDLHPVEVQPPELYHALSLTNILAPAALLTEAYYFTFAWAFCKHRMSNGVSLVRSFGPR